jgi:TonB family protein
MKSILIGALLYALARCLYAEDAVIDLGKDASVTPRALIVVPPEYPPALLGKTQNGYVDLAFGVARDGTVREPQAVASDLPAAFSDAVLEVIKLWRFEFHLYGDNCVRLGEGQRRYQLRVLFETEGDKPHVFIEQTSKAKPSSYRALKRVNPEFPRPAIRRGVEQGCVAARLHISTQGDVDRVDILKADPEGVFERAATEALMQWKYPAGGPVPGKPGGATGDVQLIFRHRNPHYANNPGIRDPGMRTGGGITAPTHH